MEQKENTSKGEAHNMKSTIRYKALFLTIMMMLGVFVLPFSYNVSAIIAPTVTTDDATGVEETNATLQGTLTDDGGEASAVGFQYGLTTSYGTDITYSTNSSGGMLYFGGSGGKKIYQYWKNNMTYKAQSPAYGNTIRGFADDDTHIYVGGYIDKVSKYLKSDMSYVTQTADYGDNIWCVEVDDTYVYAGGEDKRVYQYWKSNMTKKGQTNPDLTGDINAISVDSTYIYAGGADNKVYQYWISNLSLKAETGDYGADIFGIDQDTNYVYAGGNSINKVFQYWKSNMTKKTEIGCPGDVNAITHDSTYLYTGGSGTQEVYQFYLSNMTFRTQTASYGGTICAMSVDNNHLYVGGSARKVNRYLTSDLSYVDCSGLDTNTLYVVSVELGSYYMSGTTFGVNITGLSPGTLYHYRAVANNSIGTSYGTDKTFLTKPMEPTGLSINRFTTGFTLNWTTGTGHNNTRVQGKLGGYPASITDGSTIYNGTASTANHLALSGGDTWYYRAWSYTTWSGLYEYSDSYSQANKLVLINTTVTTDDATGVEETNATLQGTLTDDGGEASWCRFQYGLTTGYGTNTTNQTKTTGQTFSYNTTGFMPGTLYHYRAIANNTNGTSYGTDKTFLTKPNETTGLTRINNPVNHTQYITWTHGTGYNRTVVRYSTASVPGTPTDGTNAYNDTGTSFYLSTPLIGKPYYYSAWEYTVWGALDQFSDRTHGQNYIGFLTEPYAPTNMNYTLISSSQVNLTWTPGTGANRTVVVMSHSNYPTSPTDGTVIYNGTDSYYVASISGGTPYYHSAFSYTNWTYTASPTHNISIFSSNYSLLNWSFLGVNCFNEEIPSQALVFNVMFKNEEGTTVYTALNVTNTALLDISTIPVGEDILIKVWATGFRERLLYQTIEPSTFYNLTFYLPPIETGQGETGDCVTKVATNSISVTYTGDDVTIALSHIPEDIISVERYNDSISDWQFIPESNYSSNDTHVVINMTALDTFTTMARVTYYYEDCPGEDTTTTLYYIRVVETIETDYNQYDRPIENARVYIQVYINTTGKYENVSVLISDSNGYVSCWLIPGTLYQLIGTKTGYDRYRAEYQPPSPNLYGQVPDKLIRLILTEIVLPDVDYETLMDGITWTMEPTWWRQPGAFNVYFNITSDGCKLEWYRIDIYNYNYTSNTWTLYGTDNESNPCGGSVSYTIPNITGKWTVEAWFKKTNFTAHEVTQEGSFVYFITQLEKWLEDIPDYAFYIVTLVIMLIVMGYCMINLGTGLLTGYIGLGVMALAFLLHPVTISISRTDSVSGWAIWGITFMVYSIGLFIYSRI